MNRLIKLHGTNAPFRRMLTLRAGSLSMQYNKGAVRRILMGDTEILRMIYAAVRDPHWINADTEISDEQLVKNDAGFSLQYNCNFLFGNIDFRAHFSIQAQSDGLIVFSMEGKAFSTFLKNRIGFCVLHPIEPLTGKKCLIIHPDGTEEQSYFPRDISPHQPFKNIKEMRWMISDGELATLRFFGDVFETEDQRNWTDASYKTYSTPLEIPYPVEIQSGTIIKQKIELEIRKINLPVQPVNITRTRSALAHRKSVNIIHVDTDSTFPVPPIGTGVSSRTQPLTPSEAILLKNLSLSHLRSELHLFDPVFEIQYQRLLHESQLLDLPAELCMIFGQEPEKALRKFLKIYREQPVKIKSILILSQIERTTATGLLKDILPVIRQVLPGIPLGAGTNGNFAQLNRNRPGTSVDFISFAIHPQEHASDDHTMFENTEGQKYAILTARNFKEGRPVHVSPVTLQRRFNANISNFEIASDSDKMPLQVDARQLSLAGASWTVGSLKYLMESGVSSITYYETVGERGLLMGDFSSRWPDRFQADAGMCFPIYHIFRMLNGMKSHAIASLKSNRPLNADGFAIINKDSGRVFLSNMTHEIQEVELTGITRSGTFFSLNEKNFSQLVRPPFKFTKMPQSSKRFSLLPFETRIFDFRVK